MGFKADILNDGQPVTDDNRLPVDVGLTQPVTETQLKAARLQVEDPSGLVPRLVRFAEKTYNQTLHAGNLTYQWDMGRFASWSMQLNNNNTTAATSFLLQGSNDGVTWHNYAGAEFIAGTRQTLPGLPAQFVMVGVGSIMIGGPRNFRFVKITMSAAVYYPHTLTLHLSGAAFVPRRADALSCPEATWFYPSSAVTLAQTSPASYLSTDKVTTIQTSPGPPFRLVMTNLKITNTGSADTEFIIQNGGTDTTYPNVPTSLSTILYCDVVRANSIYTLDTPVIASGGKDLRFWMKTQTNVALYLNGRGVLINA